MLNVKFNVKLIHPIKRDTSGAACTAISLPQIADMSIQILPIKQFRCPLLLIHSAIRFLLEIISCNGQN